MPDIRLPALAALVTVAAAVAVPDSASAAPFGSRTLAKGMFGSDVRTAQKLLIRTGQSVRADGQFGPATRRALKRFERSAALRADGRLETTEAPTLRAKARAASVERAAVRQTAPPPPDPAEPTTETPAGSTTGIGGATPDDPVGVPGDKAVLNADGTATAPASAPPEVQAIIAAGNEIASKPYKYGGGHGKWKDTGYDCSGSVSYALHGAGLLDASMPSGGFTSWGQAGRGQWVTIYARGDHMYMIVAGLRFDTSGAKPSRWQTASRSSSGFTARHPAGL